MLLAHGTTLNCDSRVAVYQHAAELRRRGLFAEVQEAFWKQEPRAVDVLASISRRRIFIVPLFMSEGYFSEQVIPRVLGFAGRSKAASSAAGDFSAPPGPRRIRRGGEDVFYCQPVGTHPSMTTVVLARASEVLRDSASSRVPEPGEITLFIAGHGTEKNGNSRVAIEHQAESVRDLGLYAGVHAIFMEEEPRIAHACGMASSSCIVVVPYFMGDGLHVSEDIPVLLGEAGEVVRRRLRAGQLAWPNPSEKNGKLVWYSGSVGAHAQVADVIVERVREAARGES